MLSPSENKSILEISTMSYFIPSPIHAHMHTHIHTTHSSPKWEFEHFEEMLFFSFIFLPLFIKAFPGGSVVKTTCNVGEVGDTGSIAGSGKSPGGGHGDPLQYSCLKNPMDRGVWWTTVHGVTQSWTCLSISMSI